MPPSTTNVVVPMKPVESKKNKEKNKKVLKKLIFTRKNNAGQRNVIHVKVRGQDGTDMLFKIKYHYRLKKLMRVYAEHQGRKEGAYRFTFYGKRIVGTATPKDLKMDDYAVIDAMLKTGSSSNSSSSISSSEVDTMAAKQRLALARAYEGSEKLPHGLDRDTVYSIIPQMPITLRVRNESGKIIQITVRRGEPLENMMKVYTKNYGGILKDYKFTHDGIRIKNNSTADDMSMQDNDLIDAAHDPSGASRGSRKKGRGRKRTKKKHKEKKKN